MNSITAGKAYLEARKAFEEAEKAKAQAEAVLKEVLAKAGTQFAVVGGVKIAVVQGERPNYNAEALRDLVNPELFAQVTKSAVDSKKFKSALELGVITPEVAQAVTQVTLYEQVRVNSLESAEVGDTAQIIKVA